MTPLPSSAVPRRTLLTIGAMGLAGCTGSDLDPGTAVSQPPADAARWRMPDEAERHTRTWMALGASEEIWGEDLVDEVWENLADIAAAIVAFEPVSILVRPEEVDDARDLLDRRITIVPMGMDDLWIRDSGPVFTTDGTTLRGVDFNFNGWGDKQEHAADALVARGVLRSSATPRRATELVLEGGAIEVDGLGTALITRSCVLNDNRNPGWSQQEVEAELETLLGIRRVIWLPGIAGRDITDGHTDFYARFAGPGVILAALDDDPQSYDHEVTREHLGILRATRQADGTPYEVVTLTAPREIREDFLSDDFAAGYLNFYVCNGGVVMPQFGDKRADRTALQTLRKAFPGREVVQVAIDGIAAGGGGIHCATQQQPAPTA